MTRVALLRCLILIVAGAMPVLSIPLSVMGLLSMTEAALFLVTPLSLLTLLLLAHGSAESEWALKGLIACCSNRAESCGSRSAIRRPAKPSRPEATAISSAMTN